MVGSVAGLLAVAVRSFLGTLLLFFLLGIAMAAVSYYLLSGLHWSYGLIAAIIALLECVIVGIFLSGKRAVTVTVVHGLRKHRFGSTVVHLVFGRLLGISAEPAGERGGMLVRAVERLPLAQVEKRLNDTVRNIVNAPSGGGLTGWIRRRVQLRLVAAVRACTLARFREEAAQHGSIDLVKVQTDLGDRIDGLLIGKLHGGINLWTLCVLVALPVQILLVDFLVLSLMK
jgi:hypothetical protein